MGTRAAQVIFMLGVLAGAAYLVISNADSWGDWVVFGVLILTFYGFAVAVSPRIYARRQRTISRESPDLSKRPGT